MKKRKKEKSPVIHEHIRTFCITDDNLGQHSAHRCLILYASGLKGMRPFNSFDFTLFALTSANLL